MNILLILTDQQRYDTIGCNNPQVRTPHLDHLQKQSVDCRVTYTQSPQCQPSRASIFTGRYPTAHKVWWNSIQLPRSEKTIANYLSEAGYLCAVFGKLHFTEKRDESALAKHFGFHTSFLTYDWIQYCNATNNKEAVKEYYGLLKTDKWYGKLPAKQWQHDEVITDRAIRFIHQQTKNFFAVVSYNSPHPPYAAPSPYCNSYNPGQFTGPANSQTYQGVELTVEDWQKIKAQYYGCISWVDENIGRLLAAIDLDDTMVIFTSDHGDILGDHGFFSKGPFAYEGNTRVPLLLHIPGVPAAEISHLVQQIDILPTIFDFLGLPCPPGVQGKSIRQCLTDDKPINKYVLSMIGYDPRLRMIRYHGLKYWIIGTEEQCFDLRADPQENHQITNQQVLQELRFILLQALIDAEDPLPHPA